MVDFIEEGSMNTRENAIWNQALAPGGIRRILLVALAILKAHLGLATASHLGFCGSEDFDGRKIAAIARSITREQSKVSDGGVRANVEVRQRRGPLSSAAAVQQEALPGQEAGIPG